MTNLSPEALAVEAITACEWHPRTPNKLYRMACAGCIKDAIERDRAARTLPPEVEKLLKEMYDAIHEVKTNCEDQRNGDFIIGKGVMEMICGADFEFECFAAARKETGHADP